MEQLRNNPWAHSRRKYDAGLGLRSLDDVELLVAFFEARQGQMYGFRWKDWGDYKSCSASQVVSYLDQVLAEGDGVTRTFQLVKVYSSGAQSYTRPIKKPVAGTVRMGIATEERVESIHWTVDTTTGLVTFDTAPEAGAAISAGYEFDVSVRFDTDHIATSVASFSAGDLPRVPIIEVRS